MFAAIMNRLAKQISANATECLLNSITTHALRVQREKHAPSHPSFNVCGVKSGRDTLRALWNGMKTQWDSKVCRDRPQRACSICGLGVGAGRRGAGPAGLCARGCRKPGGLFVSTEVQGVAEVWQNSRLFVGSIKAPL